MQPRLLSALLRRPAGRQLGRLAGGMAKLVRTFAHSLDENCSKASSKSTPCPLRNHTVLGNIPLRGPKKQRQGVKRKPVCLARDRRHSRRLACRLLISAMQGFEFFSEQYRVSRIKALGTFAPPRMLTATRLSPQNSRALSCWPSASGLPLHGAVRRASQHSLGRLVDVLGDRRRQEGRTWDVRG